MSELKIISDQERDAILHKHARTGPPLVSAPDVVNHPPHYTAGGVECIDAIKAALTAEEFKGYCKGNALKYIWRERLKNGSQDLQKAQWYMNKLTEVVYGPGARNVNDKTEAEKAGCSGCDCKGH